MLGENFSYDSGDVLCDSLQGSMRTAGAYVMTFASCQYVARTHENFVCFSVDQASPYGDYTILTLNIITSHHENMPI